MSRGRRQRLALLLYRLSGRIYGLAASIEGPEPRCDCGCRLGVGECKAAQERQQELERIIGAAEEAAARDAWRDAEIEFGSERR